MLTIINSEGQVIGTISLSGGQNVTLQLNQTQTAVFQSLYADQNPLFRYIITLDTSNAITNLNDNPGNTNTKNLFTGFTPFHAVCYANTILQAPSNQCIATALVTSSQFNPNIVDNNGYSGLIWSLDLRNLDIFKQVLDTTANIEHQDNNGRSALSWAVLNSDIEAAKLLLQKGASASLPLKFAFHNQKQQMIDEMLKFNPAIIFDAIKTVDLAVVQYIINNQSFQPNVQLSGGNQTPFIFTTVLALQNQSNVAAFTNLKNIAQNILNLKDTDVDLADNKGITGLMWALDWKDPKIFKEALEKTENINAQDLDGNTALMWAVKNQDPKALELLLGHKANPNIVAANNISPLILSTLNNGSELVTLLLKHGADLSYKVNIKIGDHQETGTALHVAIRGEKLKAAEAIIKTAGNIELPNSENATPLYLAAALGKEELVEEILGNHPNSSLTMSDGDTLLHAAALAGSEKIIDLARGKGLDINAKGFNNNTPLHLLVRDAKNNNLIEKFIENLKADPNAPNSQGDTPLHWTAKLNPAAYDIMTKHGANKGIANYHGETPESLLSTHHPEHHSTTGSEHYGVDLTSIITSLGDLSTTDTTDTPH